MESDEKKENHHPRCVYCSGDSHGTKRCTMEPLVCSWCDKDPDVRVTFWPDDRVAYACGDHYWKLWDEKTRSDGQGPFTSFTGIIRMS